jgi:hypothetical protein
MAERIPEWMEDLVRNVGDKAVRDLVNDFRSYNPHPAQDPSAKVVPQGAGRVVTGDVGPQHRPIAEQGSGWTTPPSIDSWRPPGVDICDQLVDQQDAIDRAERIRQLGEAAALRRAEEQFLRGKAEQQPKGKGTK